MRRLNVDSHSGRSSYYLSSSPVAGLSSSSSGGWERMQGFPCHPKEDKQATSPPLP